MRILLATILAIIALIGLGEFGLRAALALGWYQPVSQQQLDRNATPNRKYNGKMRPSDNPILAMEYRPEDPNINNAGHRGFDFQLEKPADTLRIAILGDSIAYGNSVPLEDTFSPQLAAYLSERAQKEFGVDLQLYNFAVSIFGTAAEAELYRIKVRNYRPDFVLLAYSMNDPMPNDFVLASVYKSRQSVSDYQKILARSQLLAWSAVTWQKLTHDRNNINRYRSFFKGGLWQENQKQLQQMRDDIYADHSQFAAFIIPMLHNFDDYPFAEAHQLLASEFTKLGVPHLDTLPALSKHHFMDLRPHPKDDAHPNSLGHRVIAEQLGPWLWPQLEPLLAKLAVDKQAGLVKAAAEAPVNEVATQAATGTPE